MRTLYQLLTDRTIALARPGGRLGLVLPAGLATDHGSAALRRRLYRPHCGVDALVGLDNRERRLCDSSQRQVSDDDGDHGSPTRSIACLSARRNPRR